MTFWLGSMTKIYRGLHGCKETEKRTQKTKTPPAQRSGVLLWRRPTLARPIAVLPSGLQRFTSVFGMGTGGATALLSPEPKSACAARLWCVIGDSLKALHRADGPQGRGYSAASPTHDSRIMIHIELSKNKLQIVNLRSAICNERFSGIYIQEEERDS